MSDTSLMSTIKKERKFGKWKVNVIRKVWIRQRWKGLGGRNGLQVSIKIHDTNNLKH